MRQNEAGDGECEKQQRMLVNNTNMKDVAMERTFLSPPLFLPLSSLSY